GGGPGHRRVHDLDVRQPDDQSADRWPVDAVRVTPVTSGKGQTSAVLDGGLCGMTSTPESFANFRSWHVAGQPIVLPNAWDAASARLVVAAGARAVATTSAGVAWSLGSPDGDRLDRAAAIAAVARIAAAVDVPVTADIEGGFAPTAAGVGET